MSKIAFVVQLYVSAISDMQFGTFVKYRMESIQIESVKLQMCAQINTSSGHILNLQKSVFSS